MVTHRSADDGRSPCKFWRKAEVRYECVGVSTNQEKQTFNGSRWELPGDVEPIAAQLATRAYIEIRTKHGLEAAEFQIVRRQSFVSVRGRGVNSSALSV